MSQPLFRVKRYAHPKYKFLARAKVLGKWQRRYFTTEREAAAFAREQNSRFERQIDAPAVPLQRTGPPPSPILASPEKISTSARLPPNANLSKQLVPAYRGPRIHRYFGDHWSMHLPFAYELMRELRPRLFVELGVWKGESYFTFCQSAADHLLKTRCHGVDTWRGDVHMGEHDPEIAAEVARYNWRYSSFSELKSMTFMDALPDFADGSIDLLHIDGTHTYEEVKRDFESWLPKLSPHGVILFHDVMMRDFGCGVWKLWDEIARPRRSFVFEFGYGLGVWRKREISKKDPALLQTLFTSNSDQKKRISEQYAAAAGALALWKATEQSTESAETVSLRVQVFADQGSGFSEASALSAALAPRGWQTIRFEHIENLRPQSGRRLRIDPVDQPAFVNISSIKIIRDSDDTILYHAESTADFEEIETSGGLLRHAEEGTFLLIASDSDPQIFLPALDIPWTESTRLEVVMEAHPAPPSVLLRQKQALEAVATGEELSTALEASQAEIGRQRQALEKAAEVDAQLQALQTRFKALEEEAATRQTSASRLTVALEESQAEIGRQSDALQKGSETSAQLQAAQERLATLDAAAAAWQKTFADLQVAVEASRAELGRVTHYSAVKDAQIKTLENAIREAHANWAQAISELNTERSQNFEHQKRAAEQARQQAASDTALRSATEQARANSNQLSLELEAERTQNRKHQAELETQRARILDYEERLRNAEKQKETLAGELQEERNVFATEVRNVEKAIEETRALALEVGGALESERSKNRQLQAQAAHAKEQIVCLTDEGNALRSAIEQARAEYAQLSSELQKTTSLLESSADRALRLSGVLEIRKSHSAGLALYKTSLEKRLGNISQQMTAAAQAIKNGDPATPSIVDLILRDIQRIHDPSFWWKMAKAFGVLRFARVGVPRTAAERRAIASGFKEGLREITQTLSSSKTRPEDAATEISRLFQLRSQVRELLQALKLRNLFRLESPLWNIIYWARRKASSLAKVAPGSLFDPAWYLGKNPDVARSNADPLEHYFEWGAREGRDPNPVFNTAWYLAQNADVAEAGLDAMSHYLLHGEKEGRDPSPLFSTRWYLANNPDVAVAGASPLEHYLKHGALEGRDPHPLFNSVWYLEQNPEAAGLNPLEHYLHWGARHGVSPHPLFDAKWYLEQYPDVESANLSPLQHYLDLGVQEGREPHPLFNSKWYVEQAADREAASRNPLLHYLTVGAKARLSPQPLFDPHYYAENCGEALPCADLFAHYLTVGWRRRCKPCHAFDPDYYVKAYPDVAEKGLEPLTHFVLYGRAEGRVPRTDESSFDVYRPAFEISREPNIPTRPIASEVYAIAFYLPQFHRSPENDAWWGKGFTEWNHVRRGSANFEGHYQPHVPTALGYYDLEQTDVLIRQAELAQSHGIHGFCFYYYWFAGKVLLDLPLKRLTETGQPEFPFCICWANENWTRRWDGRDEDVLISQQHSPEDDLAFIKNVEPVLLHRNYIRVAGKPMLLVYRPSLLPDAAATAERWRDYFRKRGHGELHLVMVRSFTEVEPVTYGFDAIVQFPPHSHATPVTPLIKGTNPEFRGYVYDYTEIRRKFVEELGQPSPQLTVYAGVMPSWDNTARRAGDSSIWVNSCPEAYFEWISAAADLVRKRPDPNDRILFINAWNEWAEGCHLEPDERFGYAWLNATALALGNPGLQPHELAPSASFPEPPIQKPIELAPLPSPLKLAISVLFYHREDIIPSFLRTLLPQIAALDPRDGTAIDLYLAFNYQPTTGLKADILRIVAESLPDSGRSVHFIENGFNIGFGEGHNAVFAQSESDIFLMINSDVRLAEPTWLRQLVELFRGSEAAIVGLAATASRLRNDACGVPIVPGTQDFDFVDGSLVAVRSDLARNYGLFSEAFDYFYFEDADLCLRYRQLGLRLALLDLPYEHERGSSSRLFPQYAMENVLNRNRARFFQRWEHYLQTRQIPNRLAVRFLSLDRQLQCASLPAILRLLSEHPGAILDLAGIHQQLAPLFQHPRIRIIPSWQTLREGDYLRSYQVEEDHSSEQPRVTAVAARLGCTPDLEGTREHLRSLLLPAARDASAAQGQALLVVPRQEPLFEGRQPAVASFAALEEFLSGSDWDVNLLTDLGWFEVEKLPYFRRISTTCSGRSSGLEILQAVADSDLVVSCDNWIAELGQLLDKKTFVWFGATSSSRSLWNLERVAFFSDRALPCLGCYHRFGKDNRNTCLRGDIACMRQEAVDAVILALRRFLDGMPMTAAELGAERLVTGSAPSKPSSILRLDYWPASRAASVLVLIPANPKLDKEVLQQAEAIAQKAIHGMQSSRVVLDENGVSPPRGVPHPARQQAMAAIRQAMIDRHLKDERWVFWVDADIVQYRAHLIDELISRAEGGIAAPLVLMKGAISEPLSNKYGFGPGRFYDVAGFVENGRWARFTQPYFDQPGPVYDLDSVGSCYLVNADLYRNGAKHEADFASKKFIEDNCVWQEDSIAQNQAGSANCFSEHYSVCEFARQAGLPVRAFADLVAYHAKPAAIL